MTTLNDADRALLLRIARDQAVKAASAAIGAALDYADLVRQDVEARLGIPAGDLSALDDGPYQQVLDVYVSLGEAKARLAEIDVDRRREAPASTAGAA